MSELLRVVEASQSFKTKDYHQAVLDVMYQKWQTRKQLTYTDLTAWFGVEYGDTAKFLVLAGKYNQQVENGGHTQYLYNGYAGHNERDECSNIELHDQMLKTARILELNKGVEAVGGSVYKIWEAFGRITRNHSTQFACSDEFSELDTEYYACNQQWMKYLNLMTGRWLESGVWG